MPIKSEDLQPPAIEKEPVKIEARLAKSNPRPVVMQRRILEKKRNGQIVEVRLFHIP